MSRVRFSVGPVPASTAHAWLTNARRLVRAVREHRDTVPLGVNDAALDLIDAYLTTWLTCCDDVDAFAWSAEVDARDVSVLADHWLRLAALTDEENTALGWTWAPEWTAPMYDALLAGVIDALRQAPETATDADRIERRPPGTAHA